MRVGGVKHYRKDQWDTLSKESYKGKVDISFDEEHFQISDNCGGIPRGVSINSAFRMWRHDAERDKDLPTVGVYGIGMKRAIFKMGEEAQVSSNTNDTCYRVKLPRSGCLMTVTGSCH